MLVSLDNVADGSTRLCSASSTRAMARTIYLDANATAAPLAEVLEAVVETMRSIATNPASAMLAEQQRED